MNRLQIMKELLESRKIFKLVCGAGNENIEEVARLAFIYTLAGAKNFDMAANPVVVEKASEAIAKAIEYAPKLGKTVSIRPFITVSLGMKGDPHVRKARFNTKCVKCGKCLPECPTTAIDSNIAVIEMKCIGCGNCEAVCAFGAVEFYHKERDLKDVIEKCLKAGAEQVELHAAVPAENSIEEEWKLVNAAVPDNFVSMCLDRLHLGDSQLRRRLRMAKHVAGDRMIIQADGVPMSGGKDDFNTTLQAIATADIVNKSKIPVYILLSGGTNSLTAKLAQQCGVIFHGVSIGTFARNIIKNNLSAQDFWINEKIIREAAEASEVLVRSAIGEPVW